VVLDLDALLSEATRAGASDILIAVESPPVFRVDGALQRWGQTPVSVGDAEQALRHLAHPEHLERFRQQGEADFSYSLSGVGRFRVSAFRQRGSVSLAIRPIPSRVPDLRELGAPEAVAALARRESGLVLVVGRSGSGKSTTLAAMVDLINRERAVHVITLEDPVEYLHRHKLSLINQREIGVDSLTFPQAMRAALRQNPDVIVLGEVREAETAALALTAAGSGHLVIATLRQPDCASALDYLVGLFPAEQQSQVSWQLAGVLEGAVAQVLLPRSDRRGRVAVFEVLVGTPAVRTLIREGKRQQLQSLLRAGVRHGMRSLDQSWRELVERGVLDDAELPPFALAGPGFGGT
jgi:twitching motility protein PilT